MKRRILAAIVGVTAIALFVMAIPLSIRLGDDARRDTERRLERAANAAAARLPARITTPADVALPDLASEGDLAAYDARGVRIGGEGPALADPPTRAALSGETTRDRGAQIVVAVPVVRDLRVVAVVRAAEARSVSDRLVQRQRVAILLFAGGALVVAVAIGLTVSAAVTRPLRRLQRATRDLGSGRLVTPVRRSGVREIDELGDALDDAATRVTTTLERERAFSRNASHQLRTPLSSLRLAIETELTAPRADHTVVLRESLVEIDRLEQTVEDLLQLARDDAPRAELLLADIANAANDRWHGRLAAVGRPLHVRVDHDVEPVHASAAAINQIVDVLCDNALRHGIGAVTVTVRRGRGGGAVLSVSDDGPPLADRLPAASANGAGRMGLQLAAELAEREGARLRNRVDAPSATFELMLR